MMDETGISYPPEFLISVQAALKMNLQGMATQLADRCPHPDLRIAKF